MSFDPNIFDCRGVWKSYSDTPPTDADYPIWVWSEGDEKPEMVDYVTTLYNKQFWKSARNDIPAPPRRMTEQEIETAAILTDWRGQSLDFTTHYWSNIPQDWIKAWKLGAAWMRAKMEKENGVSVSGHVENVVAGGEEF